MQKLLSIPENLVQSFHQITGKSQDQWFVLCDPKGSKIGSGGGTAYLLAGHKMNTCAHASFRDYLNAGKKIIIHAGGQSRRLPAYAPSGKVLAPIPVFRWSRGQRLDQTLLDLQLPLIEKIMEISGQDQNVLVAAGDVLIEASQLPFELPDADVVCFGIWVDAHLASRHGVFFTPRNNPRQLDFMLQKPDHLVIEQLTGSHLYLMDIGVWIFSNRAVELLMKKCGWNGNAFAQQVPSFYDLYSAFGPCLGEHPAKTDRDIGQLTTAIVPLTKGEFYHFGTSAELIASTEKIQNTVQDQRIIWHNRVKPHPSIFVQNALADMQWNSESHHLWVENSHLPATWRLHHHHIITGIPGNDWDLELEPGICLDIVPVKEEGYCLRTYGIIDEFSGKTGDDHTLWMGKPLKKWFDERYLTFAEAGLREEQDIQESPLFPVITDTGLMEHMIQWMVEGGDKPAQKQLWLSSPRLSAEEISTQANLVRLFRQRDRFRQQNLNKLGLNYKRSVFYQTDLKYAASEFARARLTLPDPLPDSEPAMLRFRNHMFRSEVLRLNGQDGTGEETSAFSVLQASVVGSVSRLMLPRINVYSDQIVWGRSPARLDLAGGWSDTPPYCLQYGGSVVNMAVELNSQPPIQVFIRLCQEKTITLRSIDNGVSEIVSTFDELKVFNQIGSAFSIPKVALCLAGFHPDFCQVRYNSLEEQLADFGGGFEISLLVAIPKGSGLGTSSILAATMLGSLSDFCALNWDLQTICHLTLILEQLLTTGGGWQDQYGGILPGIKLLESEPGMQERISIRWIPDHLFTRPGFKNNWLLYYTGITRVAKNILAEIVRGMFLNEGHRLRIVDEIRQHAYLLAEAMQRTDYALSARMVAHSWKLNKALDSGTSTAEIQHIIDPVEDYALGFKLLGAGGGGYMLIACKDPDAAGRIRTELKNNPPNAKARFVNMEVSQGGFQVTRS